MRLLYVGIDDELLMDERFKDYGLVRRKKLEAYFEKMLPPGYRVILPPGLEVADAFFECYKVYRLARKFWMDKKNPYSSIPAKDWKNQKCDDDLVDVGLVRRLEDGSYYVCGSESHFEWWKKKRKSGSEGGKAKSKTTNKVLKKTSRKSKKSLCENDKSDCSNAKHRLAPLSDDKHRLAEVSTFCSSSSSDRISNSDRSSNSDRFLKEKNTNHQDMGGAVDTPPNPVPNVLDVEPRVKLTAKARKPARDRATPLEQQFWDEYERGMRGHHKIEKKMNQYHIPQIRRIIAALGEDAFPTLQIYLQDLNELFMGKGHSLKIFEDYIDEMHTKMLRVRAYEEGRADHPDDVAMLARKIKLQAIRGGRV